jgi:hypothetical protein
VSISVQVKHQNNEMAALPPTKLWLPYKAGVTAKCLQGAWSSGSHRRIYAWDFGLQEEEQILAVTTGRVIFLIDDSTATGFNDFNSSNMIFIDHGAGKFSTYFHHRTGSARVRLGELVSGGTTLAEVGKIGTIIPHLHFDLRGGNWDTSHDVRFICAPEAPSEVVYGGDYQSITSMSKKNNTETFQDTRLVGTEFIPNGIQLEPGALAYLLPVGKKITFNGGILHDAVRIHFYLWQVGKYAEFSAHTKVDRRDRFSLKVIIPKSSAGSRWYRITTEDSAGRIACQSTMPAWVSSHIT